MEFILLDRSAAVRPKIPGRRMRSKLDCPPLRTHIHLSVCIELLSIFVGAEREENLGLSPVRKTSFQNSHAQTAANEPHPTPRKQIFSLIFLPSNVQTDRPAGDSGFANAAPGAPYPLPDGAATFTFPPISESLVLRKLLRLRPSKATANSLFCNRFLQKCAPFLATSITFLSSTSPYPPVLFPASGNMQRSSLCTNTEAAGQIRQITGQYHSYQRLVK